MAATNQQAPKNYAPGLQVTFSGTVSLFGKNVTSPLTLQEPGYFEFLVAATNNLYPVCVIDTASLVVSIERIVYGQSGLMSYAQMKAGLPEVYARGPRALPAQAAAAYQLMVYTNSPVVLEPRLFDPNTNSYLALGSMLAAKRGMALSAGFALPRGQSKLRLAVTMSTGPLALT